MVRLTSVAILCLLLCATVPSVGTSDLFSIEENLATEVCLLQVEHPVLESTERITPRSLTATGRISRTAGTNSTWKSLKAIASLVATKEASAQVKTDIISIDGLGAGVAVGVRLGARQQASPVDTKAAEGAKVAKAAKAAKADEATNSTWRSLKAIASLVATTVASAHVKTDIISMNGLGAGVAVGVRLGARQPASFVATNAAEAAKVAKAAKAAKATGAASAFGMNEIAAITGLEAGVVVVGGRFGSRRQNPTDLGVPEELDPTKMSKRKLVLIIVGIGLASFGAVSIALACFFWATAKAVGKLIETGITTFDKQVIGAKTKFKDVQVDLLRGNIYIMDMTVCNPEKKTPYTTEYLFRAGEVRIGLHMWNFIKSGMKHADVTELVFKQAMVHYERPALLSSASNVQDILDFIASHKKPSIPTLGLNAAPSVPKFLSGQREEAEAAPPAAEKEKEEMQVQIHKLLIEEVGAAAMIRGNSLSLNLPTIESDDFREECEGTTVPDVIKALVSKIGKEVVQTALRLK